MRIVLLITAGSILLSIAISEQNFPIANNVQRVPRALVLQPVIKVKTKDDDEGPFDFISDWLLRVINPPKKTILPQQPPMLGPIRVAGINDEVYIKQLQSMPHRNSHVVIKVPNIDHNNVPISTPLGMNSYNLKSNFPMSSTRQMPMQSNGFYPVPSPTLNPFWSQSATPQSYTSPHANNIHELSNHVKNGNTNYHNHYRNFRNIPGYPNNFNSNQGNQQHYYNHHQSQWQPQKYYSQYQPSSQSFFSPNNPPYRQYPDYASSDFHGSITGTSDGFSNYKANLPRLTNHSRYPIHHEDVDDTTGLDENEVEKKEENDIDNSQKSEEIIRKTKFKQIDLPKVNPTSVKVTTRPSELIEIYRADRMIPTNPTYRNHFWTRTATKTTAKVSSTTERFSDDQADESSKRERKYSSRGIEEIPAPDLKAWNESIKYEDDDQNFDSTIGDDDGIIMKDGMTLGKGESQEHINEGSKAQLSLPESSNNVSVSTSSSRNSRNWKPLENSKRKKNYFTTSSSIKVENDTTKVLNQVKNETASNIGQHSDIKMPSKRKLPKFNNNGRRVRIVKSVRSSVSMTRSRAVKIPKTKN